MRNPWVRQVFLALILGLPVLMGLMANPDLSPPSRNLIVGGRGVPSWLVLVVQVEPLLIAGLWYAGGQRQRLLDELPLLGDDAA